MIIVLFFLSLIGGFLSGFLGLGGAVIMIPLMLGVPPLFGVGELTMKVVAGLSMIQVLAASISGLIIHNKNRFVHPEAIVYIGIPMAVSALAGSYFSRYMSEIAITLIFGGLVFLSLVLLLSNNREEVDSNSLSDVKLNFWRAVLTGAGVGTFSGIVGAGGGFIIIPLMVRFLKIPLRITVGTSLGIVFIGAVFGAFGKIVSGQVDYVLLPSVIIGSLLAARFGAKLSKSVSTKFIRLTLIIVISLSILQIAYKLVN